MVFWVALVRDAAGEYARFFRDELPEDAGLEVEVLGACEDRSAALEVVDALQAGLRVRGRQGLPRSQ